MLTKYKSLVQERAALDAKIDEYYGAMRLNAIDAARQLVAEFELKVEDLALSPQPQKSNAIYRNPKTGQKWFGRGRPPRWIEGQDRKLYEL